MCDENIAAILEKSQNIQKLPQDSPKLPIKDLFCWLMIVKSWRKKRSIMGQVISKEKKQKKQGLLDQMKSKTEQQVNFLLNFGRH